MLRALMDKEVENTQKEINNANQRDGNLKKKNSILEIRNL